MRLQDKVAIVTGGANGIGRATAVLFAREGASVVVADRDAAASDACVAAIQADGGEAVAVSTDVGSDSDVAVLIETAVAQYGGVDVLVNCAGIDIKGSVVATEPARWQRTLDINLASIYRTCRVAIPHMIQRGGGAIVNVASIQGMYGFRHYAAYAASKAGIIGLTRQITVDYAADNVRANAISPGAIETDLLENSIRLEPGLAGDPEEPSPPPATAPADPRPVPARTRLLGPGRSEDVAYAALYLACDDSAYVSGHNLVVDGGTSARVM